MVLYTPNIEGALAADRQAALAAEAVHLLERHKRLPSRRRPRR
jgi:hypothetical protein